MKPIAPPKIVGYIRVSTSRQGRSGLGLAAQQQAVEEYAAKIGGKIVETFREVESGKVNSRPQLEKALHLAKVTGATLVIAKLDRLSRNAAFLLSLQDQGVDFIAADMPHANSMTVGVMALVAQEERQAISRRTKEALEAAKRRGVRLGNPNGAAALKRAGKGNEASVGAIKARAAGRAEDLRPIIEDITRGRALPLAEIVAALQERGVTTPRGGRWHKSSVRNLLLRLG